MLKPATDQYDVVILGGGLAGLTLALHCHQKCPTARIAVLEKNSHPVPEAAFKVGESTVEVGAHYFAEVLGLAEHIREEQLPKNGLRFFFGAGDNKVIEPRLEVGGTKFPPVPSYQLDRGRFENFLAEHCISLGIEFFDRATIKRVHLSRGRTDHRVSFVRDLEERSINALGCRCQRHEQHPQATIGLGKAFQAPCERRLVSRRCQDQRRRLVQRPGMAKTLCVAERPLAEHKSPDGARVLGLDYSAVMWFDQYRDCGRRRNASAFRIQFVGKGVGMVESQRTAVR